MSESKVVSVKKPQGLKRVIRGQPDTGATVVSAAIWFFEQFLSKHFPEWLLKMPFGYIAMGLGLFAAGRNFSRFSDWLKDKATPFIMSARLATSQTHIKEVHFDLKFRKKFKNPKFVISILGGLHQIGEGCHYTINAKIKKNVVGDFNIGEEYTARVLWYGRNEDENLEDPTCLSRGQNENMQHQIRVMVTVTSSNRREISRHINVFLPGGKNTSFMLYTEGQECLRGAENKGLSKYKFKEVDETKLLPFKISNLPKLP